MASKFYGVYTSNKPQQICKCYTRRNAVLKPVALKINYLSRIKLPTDLGF